MNKKTQDIDALQIKYLIVKMYATIVTILFVVLGITYMSNSNKLNADYTDRINQIHQEYDGIEQEIQYATENYNFMLSQYESVLATIDELTSISTVLDEQNKELVATNEEFFTEITVLKDKIEKYERYDYALFDEAGNRNDITYDNLITLEDALENSKVNDEDLILSWILTESGGNEKAKNPESSAKGFGQILDGTSQFIYKKLMGNTDSWDSSIAYDGNMNIKMMVTYIDYLYTKNNADLYEIMKDYRGKRDIDGYVAKIDHYLANANKTVDEIALLVSLE